MSRRPGEAGETGSSGTTNVVPGPAAAAAVALAEGPAGGVATSTVDLSVNRK